jgi:addiction module HigA family antidote
MMRIKTHPGAIIREDYIYGLGLQQSELADALEVNKGTLSRLVNERSDLTPELAIKLSKVLGGTAESWMNLQTNVAISRAKATALGSWRPKQAVTEGVLKAFKGQAA